MYGNSTSIYKTISENQVQEYYLGQYERGPGSSLSGSRLEVLPSVVHAR